MAEDSRIRWLRDSDVLSVTGMVRRQAEQRPDRVACVVTGRPEPDETWTYAELDRRARAVAARLAHAAAPGDRVLVLLPAGIEFVAGFLGCLYAGAIAVPLPYAPPGAGTGGERLAAVCDSARPAATLTTGEWIAGDDRTGAVRLGSLVDAAAVDRCAADGWAGPAPDRDAVALLQYTSGSTGSPKGVMVTHANLLHNIGRIEETYASHRDPGPIEDTVAVSWLPHFHDMGLVALLGPLAVGGTAVLLSPVTFLRSPVAWLEAISRYRGRFSAAPNFAYDLCVDKITAEQQDGLDLRSWEVAVNGAEPVRPGTLERFAGRFSACGFRPAALAPCYGLAESTVFVTGGRRPEDPATLRLDRAALEHDGVATASPAGASVSTTTEVVSCGRAPAGMRVRVVDPDRLVELGTDRVGEVWVSGPSVAAGYWRRPDETAATFGAELAGSAGGPYLRTGDLGFLRDGQLFVVGRRKDLIILDGRNLYPQDLEHTVATSHPAIAPRCAAFAVREDAPARVVVAAELRPGRRPVAGEAAGARRGVVDRDEVVAAVSARVRDEHDVGLAEVTLLRPGALPLTTSGKVRRRRCRELWLAGELRRW
jgi:acyl-CoA synthetase (AMP-forming)/AMP-acid ligase II